MNSWSTISRSSRETIQTSLGIRFFPDHAVEPGRWQIEEHDTFTVARLDEPSSAAIVLGPEDNGWRYDPGPHMELRLRMQEDNLSRERSGPNEPWQRTIESEDNMLANRILSAAVFRVQVDNGLRVSLQMGPRIALDSVEIDDINWLVEGEEVPVDVTWTTAFVEVEQLSLPVHGEESEGSLYHTNVLIDDIPDAGDVELVMDDIVATGVDGDPHRTSEMAMRFEIPVEEYPELVEAE